MNIIQNSTRRELLQQLAVLPVAAGILALADCGGNTESDLTLALTLLVSGLEVALTTLQATGGLSTGAAAAGENYLSEVSTFIDFIEMEVKLAATVVAKSAAIIQEATKLGINQLPPGIPTILAATFNAVVQDIAQVLASVQTTTVLLLNHGINSFASQKTWTGKVNSKDKKALADVAAKNAAIKQKLAALKK